MNIKREKIDLREAGNRCGGTGWGRLVRQCHSFLRQVSSRFGRQCCTMVIHLLSEVSLAGFKSHLSNSSAVGLGRGA